MSKPIYHIIIALFAALFSVQEVYADGFKDRCAEYNRYYGEIGESTWLYGVFRQLSRQSAGLPLEKEGMTDVFNVIKSNHDCNDFTLNGLLRMIYLDRDKSALTDSMRLSARERILDFKYWWDDGRRDTTYRCYHTENHQALYHTAELLAGQLYKKERFTNGMTGRQHMKHAMERLEPWLDYRFRFGFSEWLSTYYDVEVLLLTNLYDFAEDKRIRQKAKNVLDLLMFDMALNSRDGYLAGASGRIYASSLLSGTHNTGPVAWLAFGTGTYQRQQLAGAPTLASSSYECPEVIREIACDGNRTMECRQRTSINVEDAPLYGLSYDKELDCHLFWGMQEFIHPLAIKMSKSISERYDTWPYRDYDRYIELYDSEMVNGGAAVNRERFALSEANIVTYHTPAYMLSSLQDYRKGMPGYQQHSWQATLTSKALVYTNHPGGENLRNSPNYWAGNEILPRSAQKKNVAVCIYNIPESHNRGFSHAYFPVDEMDETHVCGNWTFGRKGDGYIALYSSTRAVLRQDFRGELCDLKADSRRNIWLCEMGTATEWGSFTKFIDAVSQTTVTSDGVRISYDSPTLGRMTFGWDEPLTVGGEECELRGDYRYDNPYCHALFDTDSIVITKSGRSHVIKKV